VGPINCSVNAGCNNTEGSFICTCDIGYSGDGVTCTGIYSFYVTILSVVLPVMSVIVEMMSFVQVFKNSLYSKEAML
jgi:hypothetical protein